MSWGVLPWVYPVSDSLDFLDLGGYFLPHLGSFRLLSPQIFSLCTFLLSSYSGTHDSNAGAFDIVPEVSKVVLTSFNSFFLSALFISTILFSTSLILSSGSVILLLVPSRMFFYVIYCIIH